MAINMARRNINKRTQKIADEYKINL